MWFWSWFFSSNLYNEKKMNNRNLLKKIHIIIEKETDKKFDLKKNFIENDMDSLDMISIIMGIEKNFKIKIPDKDFKTIKTAKNIEDYIIRQKS